MDWAVALYIIPWFSEGLGEGLVLLDLPRGLARTWPILNFVNVGLGVSLIYYTLVF